MKITFLGKHYENTNPASSTFYFESKDSILEIKVTFSTIYIKTNIDECHQCLLLIDHNLNKNDYKKEEVIQKFLDSITNKFILDTAKIRDHCAKLTQGYSSIINGLELFI
jgi:hypothetical protein